LMKESKQKMIVIPGYKITESIHHSESTEVLKATRETDDLSVILKVASTPSYLERKNRLFSEYELGETLSGNLTPKYLGVEEVDNRVVLVLENDGMSSLETLIPKNGLEFPKFLQLAAKIASAIDEIHTQGVIHKDINPSNIIASSNLDSIKLIDFGLATRISEETVAFDSPNILEGTLSYISPEQTGRINKPVDSRSDLYSFGVTLYQMISGKTPFGKLNLGELVFSHIAKIPVSVSEIRQDIPLAVSLVIEKLMNKSPDERYQTAASVMEDLLYLDKAIKKKKKIVDFNPGQNEQSGKITLSGKLYGRDKEAAKLLDCFNRCGQTGMVVTVTGLAGIGKTALIRELYAPITTQKGFFLSGKFDQLNKGLAYTALGDALKD